MRRKNDSQYKTTKEKKEKFAEAILNSRVTKNLSENYLIRYLQREGKFTLSEAQKAVAQRGGKGGKDESKKSL